LPHCRKLGFLNRSLPQPNKNGHFLNCGEQINGVRVVASHGVQPRYWKSDNGLVAMVSHHNEEHEHDDARRSHLGHIADDIG
jgi:hypothetical protein